MEILSTSVQTPTTTLTPRPNELRIEHSTDCTQCSFTPGGDREWALPMGCRLHSIARSHSTIHSCVWNVRCQVSGEC